MNRYLPVLAGVALAACQSIAHACDANGVTVVAVMTDEVGTYDPEGNFLADVKKTDIDLNKPILACLDSPSLVKISLKPDAQGNVRSVWVNRLEVKISGGNKNVRECKKQAISRVADTSTPATSGIDPCSNN